MTVKPLNGKLVELPGRTLCPRCNGDPGAPCEICGGVGCLKTTVECATCGDSCLERIGWGNHDNERIPKYECRAGHTTLVRFTPVNEAA